MFNPYQDEAASGFPIDPPRRTQAVKDGGKDSNVQNPRRASHSGPLVPGWTKTGKKYEDISIISTRADLSTLSGLVATRTLSEDCRDKLGPSQPESINQITRTSESLEVSGSMRKNDRKHGISSSRQIEKGRASTKEPVLVSFLTIT